MSNEPPAICSDYDVLIVGGGPAGCATASELTRQGVRSLLVDRGDANRGPAVESLPPNVRDALTRSGLWDAFQSCAPLASPGIVSVWGTPEPSEMDFLFQPGGTGWHLGREVFRRSLRDGVRAAGTTVSCSRVMRVEKQPSGDWVVVLLEVIDQFVARLHAVRTRFLVDATGRSSALATRLGARRIRYDNLVAVVSRSPITFAASALDQRLWLESSDDGWWYAAPWDSGRFLAYLTDVDLVPRRRTDWPDWWQSALQRTTFLNAACPLLRSVSSFHLLSANTSRLDRIAEVSWLAVGDAAFALDPLSGQGVWNALICGMDAADPIRGALSGNPNRTREYAAEYEEKFEAALQVRASYYGEPLPRRESMFWKRQVD